MIILLNELVTALRHELESYGEMLARLDEQQVSITRRDGEEILTSVSRIEEQTAAIHRVRKQRQVSVVQLKQYLELPANAGVPQVLERVPGDYRGLITALIEENTELAIRIQQRSRQNHILLLRSMECMQRLMQSLLPSRNPTLYKENGKTASPEEGQLLCNALG